MRTTIPDKKRQFSRSPSPAHKRRKSTPSTGNQDASGPGPDAQATAGRRVQGNTTAERWPYLPRSPKGLASSEVVPRSRCKAADLFARRRAAANRPVSNVESPSFLRNGIYPQSLGTTSFTASSLSQAEKKSLGYVPQGASENEVHSEQGLSSISTPTGRLPIRPQVLTTDDHERNTDRRAAFPLLTQPGGSYRLSKIESFAVRDKVSKARGGRARRATQSQASKDFRKKVPKPQKRKLRGTWPNKQSKVNPKGRYERDRVESLIPYSIKGRLPEKPDANVTPSEKLPDIFCSRESPLSILQASPSPLTLGSPLSDSSPSTKPGPLSIFEALPSTRQIDPTDLDCYKDYFNRSSCPSPSSSVQSSESIPDLSPNPRKCVHPTLGAPGSQIHILSYAPFKSLVEAKPKEGFASSEDHPRTSTLVLPSVTKTEPDHLRIQCRSGNSVVGRVKCLDPAERCSYSSPDTMRISDKGCEHKIQRQPAKVQETELDKFLDVPARSNKTSELWYDLENGVSLHTERPEQPTLTLFPMFINDAPMAGASDNGNANRQNTEIHGQPQIATSNSHESSVNQTHFSQTREIYPTDDGSEQSAITVDRGLPTPNGTRDTPSTASQDQNLPTTAYQPSRASDVAFRGRQEPPRHDRGSSRNGSWRNRGRASNVNGRYMGPNRDRPLRTFRNTAEGSLDDLAGAYHKVHSVTSNTPPSALGPREGEPGPSNYNRTIARDRKSKGVDRPQPDHSNGARTVRTDRKGKDVERPKPEYSDNTQAVAMDRKGKDVTRPPPDPSNATQTASVNGGEHGVEDSPVDTLREQDDGVDDTERDRQRTNRRVPSRILGPAAGAGIAAMLYASMPTPEAIQERERLMAEQAATRERWAAADRMAKELFREWKTSETAQGGRRRSSPEASCLTCSFIEWLRNFLWCGHTSSSDEPLERGRPVHRQSFTQGWVNDHREQAYELVNLDRASTDGAGASLPSGTTPNEAGLVDHHSRVENQSASTSDVAPNRAAEEISNEEILANLVNQSTTNLSLSQTAPEREPSSSITIIRSKSSGSC
ncbi:MAG: hypothetical protein Q9201_006415 [Fulgogasparrea decipioides]